MLYWVLQVIIISALFIFLIHHLIHFFTSTLTVPKVKHLVNKSNEKYENIYNIINNVNNEENDTNFSNGAKEEYTLIDLLPKQEEASMKNELKNFLKQQLTS